MGKVLVRFAKQLRSHGHDADLVAVKNQALQEEPSRPEDLDLVITVFENQMNHHRYQEMIQTTKDMIRLYAVNPGLESFPKAQKLLLDTAETIQTAIVKNKNADNVHTFSETLAAIYDSFVQIVNEKDPRIPRVHYNLAETLFTIADFDAATFHYRWIVERGSWPQITDASLKAIASRYEILRASKQIPKDLAARSLPGTPLKSLDPSLQEWITWLDTHVKHSEKGFGFSFISRQLAPFMQMGTSLRRWIE